VTDDTAKQLAAHLSRARTIVAALPPVDEAADRRMTAALRKRFRDYPPRKLKR
jgi:hypothetical protein